MRNRYALTYDLKILYCPDIDLNLACKELDLTSLQFHLYDEDREYLNTGFELNPNDVNIIASEILIGKTGYLLSEQKMKWLEKFERLLKENISLILNKKVAYTYFILKLQLLGFSEGISQDIVNNYYDNLEMNKKVAHQQIFLKNLNQLIKNKSFWVPSNLEKEMNRESHFLEQVIMSKQATMYKFSFDQLYLDKYMQLCKNGIVNTLLEFNQHPSFLVRKKHSIADLIPYVFAEYKKIIYQLMSDIYKKNYLSINIGFIDDTIKHMESALRVYISLNFH